MACDAKPLNRPKWRRVAIRPNPCLRLQLYAPRRPFQASPDSRFRGMAAPFRRTKTFRHESSSEITDRVAVPTSRCGAAVTGNVAAHGTGRQARTAPDPTSIWHRHR